MDLCVFPSQVLVPTKNIVKLFFSQREIQPNVAVIFGVTGKRISDFEEQA